MRRAGGAGNCVAVGIGSPRHRRKLRAECDCCSRPRSEERRVGEEKRNTRCLSDWSSDVCSSDLCAGLVGLVIASQLESAHPATGESFELNAIAAVVLGGTSLMGGRGSIGGSLIGAFVIGVLADGLVMMGVSEFWQIVIKGAV